MDIHKDLSLSAIASRSSHSRDPKSERYSLQKRYGLFAVRIPCSGLDEKDKAPTLLEKICQEHQAQMMVLNVDPCFHGSHSDPRFKDLALRMNFQP